MSKRASKEQVSIAQRVRSYVHAHPVIKECMRLGLLNNRALAREVAGSQQRNRIDAYAMAVGRLASRLKKFSAIAPRADAILRSASMVIRTQMSVATIQGGIPGEAILKLKQILPPRTPVAFVQAENHSIILAPERHQNLLTKVWKVMPASIRSGLAQISFIFPSHAVDTRGVISQLTSLLSGDEINLIEIIGVSGELLILLPEEQLGDALEVLKLAGVGQE